MKTVLPWVIILALFGGIYLLYSSNKEKDADLAKQAVELQDLDKLRADSDQLKKMSGDADELKRLRKDNEEMLQMRGELHRLRDQNKQLTAQLTAAEAKNNQAQQAQQQLTAQLVNENEKVQAVSRERAAQMMEACIANLRRVDAAKQQWATDNKKNVGDVPTANDLATYLPEITTTGINCPASGTYSINAIGAPPTCSIPGHALPKPQ